MVRELRRLLIDPQRLEAERLALSREESHYLGRVLRLGPAGRFAVVDGCGRLWSAALAEAGWAVLEQPLERPLQQQAPARLPLVLALAMPRRDGEVVLRMATELGVDAFQLVRAERSVLRGAEAGEGEVPPRWRTIVREAAEQCERLWLPRWLDSCPAMELFGQSGPGVRLLATTRHGELPSPEDLLAGADAGDLQQGITLAIGPEGGWSEAEEGAAAAGGWQAVTLGEGILRSSTAAVAGVARLAALRSEGA
jgi:16S rRNA (uracil1498-N3)-methyltransferase